MRDILCALDNTLNSAEKLLGLINSITYQNKAIGPYYSSIGSHMRHLLDVVNCVIEGIKINEIDLTSRQRNLLVSENIQECLKKIRETKTQLMELNTLNKLKRISVVDDHGLGKIKIEYTIESILAQSNSHAIHHFASISYILYNLDVNVDMPEFGFNPSTPRKSRIGA